MLSRGQLTNPQLRAALDAQREEGGRIGEWLETLGFASEQQVTGALAQQWACPVLPRWASGDVSCGKLIPFRLLQRLRMLPVQFIQSTGVFYIAFSEGIDHRVLHAIERMLECRTEACLVGHKVMDEALEQLAHQRRSGELLFESWREVNEMARVVCGYVQKLGAESVRIVGCGEFIWVRLEAGADLSHLLFRSAAEDLSADEIPRSGSRTGFGFTHALAARAKARSETRPSELANE
jgi:hypothetical protein